jgi:hypothetical protein
MALKREQRRANGELDALLKTNTPSIAVGAAMQHAVAQHNADRLRVTLFSYCGIPEEKLEDIL